MLSTIFTLRYRFLYCTRYRDAPDCNRCVSSDSENLWPAFAHQSISSSWKWSLLRAERKLPVRRVRVLRWGRWRLGPRPPDAGAGGTAGAEAVCPSARLPPGQEHPGQHWRLRGKQQEGHDDLLHALRPQPVVPVRAVAVMWWTTTTCWWRCAWKTCGPGSGRPAWWLSSGPPPTFSGRRIPSTGPTSGTSSSTLSTTSSRLLDLRHSCTIFGNLSSVLVLRGRFIFQGCATFGSDLRRTKLRPLLLFFIRINWCGCLWVCGRCFGCECTGGGG